MLVIFVCLSVCFYFGETRIDKVGKQDSRDDTEQHATSVENIGMLTICFSYIISTNNSSHLQDLKEITHDYLYENYRTEKLSRSAENLSD